MLVLSRKLDEEIVIADDIKITVVELDNGRVKLGIDAPKEIDIVRGELYHQVEEENKAAVKKIKLADLSKFSK